MQTLCIGCYGRVRAAPERNAIYQGRDPQQLPSVHWRVPHRILRVLSFIRGVDLISACRDYRAGVRKRILLHNSHSRNYVVLAKRTLNFLLSGLCRHSHYILQVLVP